MTCCLSRLMFSLLALCYGNFWLEMNHMQTYIMGQSLVILFPTILLTILSQISFLKCWKFPVTVQNLEYLIINVTCTLTGGIVSNTLRPPIPEYCDSEWKSLMERCWSTEPLERPKFSEVANQLRSLAAKVPPKVYFNR